MAQAGTHSVSMWRRAGWFALAVLAWFLALAGALWLVPGTKPTPVWTAASGKAAPAEFLYLMYPASESVRVFDAPGGNDAGTLTRAVTCTHENIEAEYWVSFWTPTRMLWVRRAHLRFEAPESEFDYFRAYRQAVVGQSTDGFGWASISTERGSHGGLAFSFELCPDDDHVERYLYEVTDGVPHPLEMDYTFGPGLVLANIPKVLVALVIATMVAILVGRIGRWRMRAMALPKPEGTAA